MDHVVRGARVGQGVPGDPADLPRVHQRPSDRDAPVQHGELVRRRRRADQLLRAVRLHGVRRDAGGAHRSARAVSQGEERRAAGGGLPGVRRGVRARRAARDVPAVRRRGTAAEPAADVPRDPERQAGRAGDPAAAQDEEGGRGVDHDPRARRRPRSPGAAQARRGGARGHRGGVVSRPALVRRRGRGARAVAVGQLVGEVLPDRGAGLDRADDPARSGAAGRAEGAVDPRRSPAARQGTCSSRR